MIWIKYRYLFLVLLIVFSGLLIPVFKGAKMEKTVDGRTEQIFLDKPHEYLGFSLLFGAVAALSLTGIMAAVGIVESPSDRLYPDIQPVSREELERRLLSLNNPKYPWEIVRGKESDFIARWKLADSKWWEIMGRAGLKMIYRGLLLIDDDKKQVRYFEEMEELTWSAGFRPNIVEVRKSYFGGRIFFSKRKAVAYGIKSLNPFETGELYNINFDVNMIRGPIIETVERAGWNFTPVSARRHATK